MSMSWIKLPGSTDPQMMQSMRTDFSADMERQVIDGGVAEGRPESPLFPGMVWLALLIMGGLAALLVYFLWATPWFP